jgi:hypothetical protein
MSRLGGDSLPLFRGSGDIEISDEIVTYVHNGEPVATWPLRDFKHAHRRAGERIASYEAKRAEIVRLKRGGKPG